MKTERTVTTIEKRRLTLSFKDLVELLTEQGIDVTGIIQICLLTPGVLHKTLTPDDVVIFEIQTRCSNGRLDNVQG